MNTLPPPPPQWVMDLNSPPASKAKPSSLPDPPGYSSTTTKVCDFLLPSSSTCRPCLSTLLTPHFLPAYSILQKPTRNPNSQTPHNRRNRYPQSQEIMGTCSRPRKSLTYERNNDVHVRKQSTDILYNDGVYAIQESDTSVTTDERSVPKV
jgi:hypothetical protein